MTLFYLVIYNPLVYIFLSLNHQCFELPLERLILTLYLCIAVSACALEISSLPMVLSCACKAGFSPIHIHTVH